MYGPDFTDAFPPSIADLISLAYTRLRAANGKTSSYRILRPMKPYIGKIRDEELVERRNFRYSSRTATSLRVARIPEITPVYTATGYISDRACPSGVRNGPRNAVQS